MTSLPIQLALAAFMFLLTIIVHIVGLMGLQKLASLHLRRWRTPWLGLDRLLVPTGFAFGLALIHFTEVMIYAESFVLLRAADSLDQALWFSLASYTTADVPETTLDQGWRVFGAFEALNGILLLGWSTAFLFENLRRILTSEDSHPLPLGAIARPSPRPSRSGRGAPPGTNSSDTELMQ